MKVHAMDFKIMSVKELKINVIIKNIILNKAQDYAHQDGNKLVHSVLMLVEMDYVVKMFQILMNVQIFVKMSLNVIVLIGKKIVVYFITIKYQLKNGV